jgi:hypothetical protein
MRLLVTPAPAGGELHIAAGRITRQRRLNALPQEPHRIKPGEYPPITKRVRQ